MCDYNKERKDALETLICTAIVIGVLYAVGWLIYKGVTMSINAYKNHKAKKLASNLPN